mmetsp:Transcript_86931/g.243624  ORF Transcript_86931/g.243624 Transcript_86931/m.243624 type:complete len:311 (+) Transcript_86931:134-1066(+)
MVGEATTFVPATVLRLGGGGPAVADAIATDAPQRRSGQFSVLPAAAPFAHSWVRDSGAAARASAVTAAAVLGFLIGATRLPVSTPPSSRTALQRRRRRGDVARRAEATSTTATAPPAAGASPESTATQDDSMVSPFEGGGAAESKSKLSLTLENVDKVLDELRPYLQNDGGDCKIVDIDGTVVRLELQGACSSCSASSVTLKMGIERTLIERIPEITEVVSVMPDQEPLSKAGVEEVLDGIRPFLSVSGGAIELTELTDDADSPKIVLTMKGPPLKSMAVRVEVVNRIKRKYPLLQDVEIVGEGGVPTSA